VEEDPRTSVQRIAATESIGVPLVWRILYEQSLYSFHIQRVQATFSDHHATLLAKCVVSAQFVVDILFNDEVGFTRDGIVTFIVPMSEWMTVPTPPWHQDVNIDWGILGDQPLGLIILSNRLTGAVYHYFFGG
jgi:hypothetical protein